MRAILFILLSSCVLAACKNGVKINETGGQIVLNDSMTIVTEKDTQFLKNDYTDIDLSATPAAMVEDTSLLKNETIKNEISDTPSGSVATSKFYIWKVNNKNLELDGIMSKEAQANGNTVAISKSKLPKRITIDNTTKNNKMRYKANASLTLLLDGQKIPINKDVQIASLWKNASITQQIAIVNWNDIQYQEINKGQLQKAIELSINKASLSTKQKNTLKKNARSISSINDKHLTISVENYNIEWSGTDKSGKPFKEILTIHTK